jgi:hypothetical protein
MGPNFSEKLHVNIPHTARDQIQGPQIFQQKCIFVSPHMLKKITMQMWTLLKVYLLNFILIHPVVLGGLLRSMKTGSFITKMSKRFSCLTIVSCYEDLDKPNPLSWYHEHYTPDIGLCNTTTRLPIVSGTLPRDASVVLTINSGSVQCTHTNWTGWTIGRCLQWIILAT